MAIQSYVKRQNEYEVTLEISGADADLIGGDYQVYVSLIHEWGTPVFNHSRLSSDVGSGDTTLQVYDPDQFSVGDRIIFLDGRIESVEISDITDSVLTVDALSNAHYSGVFIMIENLATRDSANNYSYAFTGQDLESSGQHKVKWHYIQSGVSTFSDSYLQVYQPYIDSGTFFDLYPELEIDFDDYFDSMERVVRGIIETTCGQTFDYFPSKSLVFDGNGKNALNTGIKINEIIDAYIAEDHSDISDLIHKDNSSEFYLRMYNKNSTWNPNLQYEIVANWGWGQVPNNVSMAAAILIADQFNEDSKYPKHGVVEVYMDTHRMRFDSIILGTTGNLDADILLMDYTLFPIGDI